MLEKEIEKSCLNSNTENKADIIVKMICFIYDFNFQLLYAPVGRREDLCRGTFSFRWIQGFRSCGIPDSHSRIQGRQSEEKTAQGGIPVRSSSS